MMPKIALILPALLIACESNQGIDLPSGNPSAPCVCDPMSAPESCKIGYKRAQICPDLSPVKFCSRYTGSSTITDVILSNRGYEGLRIESARLLGDASCSFQMEVSFRSGGIVGYMRQEVVRLTYKPQKIGQDHVVLRIESNAENFPQLNIAVCGEGIKPGMPQGGDGGLCLECMKPASEAAPACERPDGGADGGG